MIKVTDLISKALKEGVDFGKGQIATRVHYLTRMGILPGAVRKQESDGSLSAYYPDESVEILRRVAQYQRDGYNLTQIKLLLGRPAFSLNPISNLQFPISNFQSPISNLWAFFAGILLVLTLLQLPYTYRSLISGKASSVVAQLAAPSGKASFATTEDDEVVYIPVQYKNLQKIKDVNFTIK